MATGRTVPFPDRPSVRGQAGFTYLGVLFLVALMGLGLAGASQSWSMASQRARERELLWVGTQYARALKSYYDQSPGAKQYPVRLEDLLEDKRFPTPRRHLRRLYPDPITRGVHWGLVETPDGRIAGVHSRSGAAPWKRANFPLCWEHFSKAEKYSDWKFVSDSGLPRKPAAQATAEPGLGPGSSVGRAGEQSPVPGNVPRGMFPAP